MSARAQVAALIDAHLLDMARIETGVLPCIACSWVGDSIDHFRLHQADVVLAEITALARARFREVLAAHGRVSLDDLDQVIEDLVEAVTQ